MNKDRIEECLLKFTTEIASLNSNMRSTLDKLSAHEQRITTLEQNKSSLKDTTIQWLIKGLVASVFTIGSLAGAGSILMKVFGS